MTVATGIVALSDRRGGPTWFAGDRRYLADRDLQTRAATAGHPARIRIDPVPERVAAVPGRADGRQDGAAATWGIARGLEHLPAVLSGGAAAWLHLRAFADEAVFADGANIGACGSRDAPGRPGVAA